MFDEDTVTAVFYRKTIFIRSSIHCTEIERSAAWRYIKVAATEFTNFLNAVQSSPVCSLDNIADSILMEFLQRLEKVTEHHSRGKLGQLQSWTKHIGTGRN